jgi:hypothetical protein
MAAKGQLYMNTKDRHDAYPNVDFSNWIVNKNGCRQFMANCTLCNKQKGYVREACFLTKCKSCSGHLNKIGKPSPKKGVKTGKPAWNRSETYLISGKKRARDATSRRLRHAIYGREFIKNNRPLFTILEYTAEDLLNHLESRFTSGMTWDNYGKGSDKWNIDHIIPDSSFKYDCFDHPEFKKCWALENLQPLWEPENLKKSNKVIK